MARGMAIFLVFLAEAHGALYKHWCAHGQPEVFLAGMAAADAKGPLSKSPFVLLLIPALKAKYDQVMKAKEVELKDVEVLCLHAGVAVSEEERENLVKMRNGMLSEIRKPAKAAL